MVQAKLSTFSPVEAMFLGRFVPIMYASFVLVALSEYSATRMNVYDRKLTMRKPIDEEIDISEDIENLKLFPDLTLVHFGTNKKLI